MEGVLVSAAIGVMNSVLAKLTAFLGEEYKHAKGVRDDLVFLRSELSTMNIVLQKLADVDQLDELSRDWRDRVRDLAYDIEDCIDLSVYRLRGGSSAGESGLVAKVARMAKKIGSFRQIASQIQKLKARVVEVSERRNRYTLPGLVSTSLDVASSSKVDSRLCALWTETKQLVGIDGPRDDIISRLEQDSLSAAATQHDVRMVSIVGCAGLGKTTLAKQVYDKIKGEFECKAFVSVSQKPNIKELLLNISTQVGKSTNTSDDIANLVDNLRDYLKQKSSSSSVVPNSPSPDPAAALDATTAQLRDGAAALRERRNEGAVVRWSSSSAGAPLPCSMAAACAGGGTSGHDGGEQRRSNSAARRLKYIVVVDDIWKPEPWNFIGEALVKTSPGSIIILTTRVKEVAMSSSSSHGGFVYPMKHLDDAHSKRWIAEGFINANPGESVYEAGLRYFNVLINWSLIQPWDECYGEVLTCRVHDVILSFLVSKSVEENFMTLLDSSGLVPLQHSNCCKVRRMSLQGSYYKEEFASRMKSNKPNVRETGVTVLPANIGRLQHLETLDIRDSGVTELPPSIVLLQRFALLFIHHDVKFPAEGVSKMQALEQLICLVPFNQPVSFLKELGELTKLRVLVVVWEPHHIVDSDEAQAEHEKSYEKIFTSSLNALDRHSLHTLFFFVHKNVSHFLFDSWFPTLQNLRRLSIINALRRTTIPSWIRHAAKLELLELENVYVTQDNLEMLGDLKALESLALPDSNTRGSWLTISNHGFRSLKFAHIANVLFMPDSMPNLKDLHIEIRLEQTGENDSIFQHLPSTLRRVDAKIVGNPHLRDAVSKLEEKILNVANTHPNRPSLTTGTYIY
uniref:AAA+ ATPase domain-containing protein n=1 Tax=Oryza glumipatula TaxID=40148 RepID=A0A0E0A5H6_9ORYZ